MKILPQQLQIEFEKVNFVYDHLAAGLTMNVLVGAALCFVMQEVVGFSYAIIWYIGLFIIVSIRFLALYLYKRSKDRITTLNKWRLAVILGAFMMGSVWGGGGVFLFPQDDVGRQIFLVFIIGGMVMGAVPYLSSLLPAYLFFLFPAELPISLYLFSFSDTLHLMLGAVNLLFMITMIVAARLNQKNFLQSLMLRFVNQDLVKQLNETNNELEHKIYLKGKIEQDLRENEHRFKALSNAAHDGVIIHKDGIIIEANEAVARMLGITVNKMIGAQVLDFIVTECREAIISRLRNPTNETIETTGQRKDGSTFQAEINSGDIIYQGMPARIVSVRDISKQKQIEWNLRHAKNAAEEADKLKSEFLASVSHELRTPLNAMLGFMQILSETELTEEQRDFLVTGQHSGKQLLLLINDLLDLSRIETGYFKFESKNIDLQELMEETVRIMSVKAKERNDDLILTIPGILPERVMLDPDRVRQVLINLLGNAIKFTESGKVTVSVTAQPGNILRFEVKDSGIGIPDDKQKLIFNRFTQLDASISRNYGGAGLGLAISRELIAKMGGDIGVISELGHGAIFWFTLPYEEADKQYQDETACMTSDFSTDALLTVSILVVEDEQTNQIIARHMLEKLGCQVKLLDNGQQAVDNDTAYDLIFMDMQMPILDGLAATKMLRDKGVNTPIIAMTANAMPGDRERCLAAGMDDYLSKPIEQEKLRATILKWVQDNKQAASI